MRRTFVTALLALLAVFALPATAMAGQTPAKIAVIVEENANWNQIIGATGASYINNTLLGQSLSIDPNSSTCDYPNFDGAGTTGTVACTSGMFQNYRTTKATHFLTSGSAPEYAWLSMGTDANIRDHVFPCGQTDTTLIPEACFSPAQFDTLRPENGAPGYSPGHFDITDPAYNIFRALKAQGGTWNVYAEDYLGTSTSCSTASWSAITSGTSIGNFYARKHNPFLLTWDMSPDAAVDSTFTPAAAPGAADCKNHMQDFPNNTPNGSVVPTTNFAGTEGANFGSVTFIIPSMCHDGHNSASACGTGRGGTADLDLWLSDNMPGIRKDVGQNGVVVTTWDEDGTGQADGNGHAPPVPTFITPGTDSSGNPGILASGLGSNTTGFFSHSSTLKALLASAGSSCSTLDNNVFYQGQATYGTAQTQCSNAALLPVNLAAPSVIQHPKCSALSTTSLSCGWSAATKAGDLLVATIGVSGSPGTITPPTGWTEIKRSANADEFACTDCASQGTASQTWSWVTAGNSAIVMAELRNTSGAVDQAGSYTSSATKVLTADSGPTTGATTQADEVAVAGLYHAGTDALGTPTGGFTKVDEISSGTIDIEMAFSDLTATATPETTATYGTLAVARGTVVTFKE